MASVNVPDTLDTSNWKVQTGTKLGSVGKLPLPGTSFRVIDPETEQELPVGEDGLIVICGPQVMSGYLNDGDKTAEAIAEIDGRRWYKTGDKGHLDEEGFLTIVDRYSRFAKLGGEMVSLGAVEQLVHQQLQAAGRDSELDVMAVNLPHDKKGEQVILLLPPQLNGDELRTQLVDSGCNPLMIPSLYLTVDELPKLGSGKADFKGGQKLALQLLAAKTA